MKIAITGASGFVGRHLVDALADAGHRLRLIVHKSRPESRAGVSLETVTASVHNSDSLAEAFRGVDLVFHLVGIIAETKELTFEKTVSAGTHNVVAACRACNVKRIIYLSAAGASSSALSKYHQAKWKAEEAVRSSGLKYTIFRPSVIFGQGDGFVSTLVSLIRKFPVVPIIGDGRYELQPVYVKDLVSILKDSVRLDRTLNKTIEVGGPERLQFREIISTVKRVLKKKRGNIYLPLWFMRINALILERIMKPAPITADQLLMLKAGNICDNRQLDEVFDIKLTGFEEGLKRYLR